jgi:hypothetical protein
MDEWGYEVLHFGSCDTTSNQQSTIKGEIMSGIIHGIVAIARRMIG